MQNTVDEDSSVDNSFLRLYDDFSTVSILPQQSADLESLPQVPQKLDRKAVACLSAEEKLHRIRLQQKAWREKNKDVLKERYKDRCYQKRYKDPKTKEEMRLKRITERATFIVRSAKQRARQKSLPFNIDESDIDIPKFCPILGIELCLTNTAAKDNSPSLDRIIPELGYVKGNVQVISHLANCIKSNASIQHLVTFSKWVLREYTIKHVDESNT